MTENVVFGDIDHNRCRHITARMAKVDTSARERRLHQSGGTGGQEGVRAQEGIEGGIREREGRVGGGGVVVIGGGGGVIRNFSSMVGNKWREWGDRDA